MCIHHILVEDGLEHIPSLSNAILQMYGKCSSVEMASAFFSQMPTKDHHSWNHMIRAYTRYGQAADASLLFRRMLEEGVVSNSHIYSSLLSVALGSVGLSEGIQVHVRVANSGLLDDVYVGTALVGMYGKCGCLDDAEKMFFRLQIRDVTLWNTMIALYVQHEKGDNALGLFYKMLSEGTSPTIITYLSILSACDISAGKHVHLNWLFHDHKDVVVETAFLNMYGKLGLLDKASRVFVDMGERDTVCWNAIIGAYAQNGEGQMAIQLFQRMCQEALIWDMCSFCTILASCANYEALVEAKRVHALLYTHGYDLDVIVGNVLVNMYGKCGDVKNAWRMFSNSQNRDTVSWNGIIRACSELNDGNTIIHLFEQMIQECVLPDNITIATVIEILSKQGAVSGTVEHIYSVAFSVGLHMDVAVGNALIIAYGGSGRLKQAHNLLNQMPKKDRITYINFLLACASKEILKEGQLVHAEIVATGCDSVLPVATALICMYGKASCLEDAWIVFLKQPEKDAIFWTAMISAVLYNGLAEDALHLFEQMMQQDMKADKATIVSILDACADYVALAAGRCMHDYSMVSAFESDLRVGTALLNMYGRCGMLEDARRVFRDMSKRDIVTWTAIVAAHAQQGHAGEVQKLLDQMREDGVEPNAVTFVGLLNACCYSGLVDEGRQWFRSMKTSYGIVPAVDHYNCMIDLLARAGLMEEAEALVKEMPMTPTSSTWTILLGACKDQFDMGRGGHAAENVLELDPDRASAYVTLSNLCTASGRKSPMVVA
ncbi:hypothetical protein KP509_03G076500 [Ceratopteris richardii]|nr:hypothetical protein KP509_03G076500 [Ceratopteris richardii]